jgi:hypothetical protein
MLVATLVAGIIISGCGGTGPGEGKVIARVGATPIPEATLRHWTATWIKDDYYQALGRQAPAGLASDPPDYASCVRAARSLRRDTSKGTSPLSTAQLRKKCRQLYRSAGLQALSYMVSTIWRAGQVRELGHAASAEDIARAMRRTVSEKYPTTKALQTYLAHSGFSRADFFYTVKTELLSTRFLDALTEKLGGTAGQGQQDQKALARLIEQSNAKWKARTTCGTGHLVWVCRDYSGSSGEPPSVSVLVEQLAQ